MILTENVLALKKHFPEVWKSMEALSDRQDTLAHCQLETSRKGLPTLTFQVSGSKRYVHSRYDPEQESLSLIESLQDVERYNHVLFYGFGLGYHVEAFAQRYPNHFFSVYEPRPEVLYRCLSAKSLKSFLPMDRIRHFLVETKPEDMERHLDLVMGTVQGEILLVTLPSYEHLFKESCSHFYQTFLGLIKNRRSQLHTNFAFEKRWTVNSMLNFGKVLQSPNILLEKADHFRGKPAVLVAAGPSLQEELEHLRHIKEHGLAYIFSVGSAINPLIRNGIYPDAACTYDPTVHNQKVFEELVRHGITSIPLIFGSSVGYETLIQYPGPMFHFLTSQDTVSPYLLKENGGRDIPVLNDAPSIAVVALQMLIRMQCRMIVLVGQNLAFRGTQAYAEGIPYYDGKQMTDEEKKKWISIEDVDGQTVFTSEGFNRMRLTMEQYISQTAIPVINTTVGGAKIRGTTFQRLRDVIAEQLTAKVVEDDWWVSSGDSIYNKEYAEQQLRRLERDYDALARIFDELDQQMAKIHRVIGMGNVSRLDRLFVRWDQIIHRLTSNDFFRIVINPMNRVHTKLLKQSLEAIKYEKGVITRAEKIMAEYKRLLDSCKQDYRELKSILNQMREELTDLFAVVSANA